MTIWLMKTTSRTGSTATTETAMRVQRTIPTRMMMMKMPRMKTMPRMIIMMLDLTATATLVLVTTPVSAVTRAPRQQTMAMRVMVRPSPKPAASDARRNVQHPLVRHVLPLEITPVVWVTNLIKMTRWIASISVRSF